MTWTSSGMSVSDSERRSIKIGREIHQAVVDEGKAEAARLGCRVCAYLDHDLIGTGKLPFVRWDERTGEVSRRFSPGLSRRIRDNVGHLKVYFDYVLALDRNGAPSPGVGSSEANRPPTPETRQSSML